MVLRCTMSWMGEAAEVNYHFKQVLAGATAEIAMAFGEALLAVDAQRRNAGAEAPGLLRKAWLALARHLISTCANALTPQQVVFLLSGAIGDTVWVKTPTGERVAVPLLPSKVYADLLAGISTHNSTSELPCLLTPLRRIGRLAQRKLEPLDLNKPGRYREPVVEARPHFDLEDQRLQLAQACKMLRSSQQDLQQAARRFTDALRAERLGPVLKEIASLGQLAGLYLDSAEYPLHLASLPASPDEKSHPAVLQVQALRTELSTALSALADVPGALLHELHQVKYHGTVIASALGGEEGAPAEMPLEAPIDVNPEVIPRVLKDFDATNGTLVQIMQNSPNRSAWSATRVLLAEQVEKFSDPLHECFATPANLEAAISKAEALHPNCFTHDAAGHPLLPPIVIEPGVGVVRWLDDRFLLSFVCTDIARPGKELALSPVDLAVLQIYGLFLARGDIFNYRGERIYTNFMGEYAGEVESKAAVKFTGADKKMTLVSASAEKDASSREDAVRDYIDFLFCITNGLPLPKRISPRKITVILKYCIVGSPERTAGLVLRFIAPVDFQAAREILAKLSGRQPRRIIELVEAALRDDVQLSARYRRDTRRALEEVMGREWVADAAAAGHFDPVAQGPPLRRRIVDGGIDITEPAPPPPSAGHDYFDV